MIIKLTKKQNIKRNSESNMTCQYSSKDEREGKLKCIIKYSINKSF